MENVFRTRSESANRVYRSFRTGPENFPILFGFDASKGISCSESSVAGNFERNFSSFLSKFFLERSWGKDACRVRKRLPPTWWGEEGRGKRWRGWTRYSTGSWLDKQGCQPEVQLWSTDTTPELLWLTFQCDEKPPSFSPVWKTFTMFAWSV